MSRTTEALVEAIIDYDDDIDLSPFIDVADSLVENNCLDSGYTEGTLTLITTWLAAHFYHIRDQHVASEKAGSVAVSYQYKIDRGLDQTKYGQTAMLIDDGGALAQLNKRIKEGKSSEVSIGWLGTDYDE